MTREACACLWLRHARPMSGSTPIAVYTNKHMRHHFPLTTRACDPILARSGKIFRAHGGILARTLWWDDDAVESGGGGSLNVSLGPPAFQSTSSPSHGATPVGSGGGGGDGLEEWEIRRDRAEARYYLRQFMEEAMALADFFARDNPRGKVRHCLVAADNQLPPLYPDAQGARWTKDDHVQGHRVDSSVGCCGMAGEQTRDAHRLLPENLSPPPPHLFLRTMRLFLASSVAFLRAIARASSSQPSPTTTSLFPHVSGRTTAPRRPSWNGSPRC